MDEDSEDGPSPPPKALIATTDPKQFGRVAISALTIALTRLRDTGRLPGFKELLERMKSLPVAPTDDDPPTSDDETPRS